MLACSSLRMRPIRLHNWNGVVAGFTDIRTVYSRSNSCQGNYLSGNGWRRSGSADHFCTRGALCPRPNALRALDPRVPLVALVFPVAAVAVADVIQRGGEFDRGDVFRLLVAELALDARAQRCAIGDRQWPVVQLVGEQGLRVVCIV